jgi:hypothetical protein
MEAAMHALLALKPEADFLAKWSDSGHETTLQGVCRLYEEIILHFDGEFPEGLVFTDLGSGLHNVAMFMLILARGHSIRVTGVESNRRTVERFYDWVDSIRATLPGMSVLDLHQLVTGMVHGTIGKMSAENVQKTIEEADVVFTNNLLFGPANGSLSEMLCCCKIGTAIFSTELLQGPFGKNNLKKLADREFPDGSVTWTHKRVRVFKYIVTPLLTEPRSSSRIATAAPIRRFEPPNWNEPSEHAPVKRRRPEAVVSDVLANGGSKRPKSSPPLL